LQTKRQGSVQLAELGVEEKHVLGVIRQSEKYEPTLLLEAWRRFEKEGTGENGNLTVQELAEKFVARQTAVALSAAVGLLLARRSLSPVSEMAARARQITADSLGGRLPVPNPHDELGQLAIVFKRNSCPTGELLWGTSPFHS
jgi:HAMP domain-containing protein